MVGAVPGGQSIDLQVTGVGGVPASGVSGVALNVTVDGPTGTGFVTTWPTGEPRPNASTHNFSPGLTAANLGARQGGCRWAGVAVQLGGQHPPHRRCDRLLLGHRRCASCR